MGQMTSDKLWQTISEGVATARAAGKPSGTLVGNAQKALEVLDGGMAYVAVSSDLNLMVTAADAQLKTIREALS